METSPEGLVDSRCPPSSTPGCGRRNGDEPRRARGPRTPRSGSPATCRRNGDEPRRARGHCGRQFKPTTKTQPQWRRAPKGSWTCPWTTLRGHRWTGRNGDEPRRARGPHRIRHSRPCAHPAAMETSPEGLVDAASSSRPARSRSTSRNGDEPRRARGPPDPVQDPTTDDVPQWRRAPKGSWTRRWRRRTRRQPPSRNGDEPRRARGPTKRDPDHPAAGPPQWRRAPKGSWTPTRPPMT